MSIRTGIQWTDATWNPVTGCTKVSPGCDHCYAEAFAERWRGVPGHPYEQGFDVRLWPERLELPLRWRKPRRVFVNSMSDLFIGGDEVPDAFVAEVFAVMALAARHTFQVLTKRPGRMASLLSQPQFVAAVGAGVTRRTGQVAPRADWLAATGRWPLPNVWLGTSIESQKWADVRIPALLRTPAAVRFLSCEPLLGPIDLSRSHRAFPYIGSMSGEWFRQNHIDWVIVGGESGSDARPMHPQWARDLRDQCQAASVPFFMKQQGAWRYVYEADSFEEEQAAKARGDHAYREHPWRSLEINGIFVDGPPTETCATVSRYGGHNGDPAGWPADLRVREYPARGGAP